MNGTDEITTPLRLYLIRHGGTEWTASGRHTGRTDIPLTMSGEEEARAWSVPLSGLSFARVLTSPRQRARQTCALVALVPPPDVEPDLAEWDYGDYEGMRSVDIRRVRPGWNVFRDGCPNGESPAEVSTRADGLITRLRTMHGNVALFSHGQFGAALVTRWIGLPLLDAQHFLLGTASLSILGYGPHHPDVPIIVRLNAVAHATGNSDPARGDAERSSLRTRALQRWDNEGGSPAP